MPRYIIAPRLAAGPKPAAAEHVRSVVAGFATARSAARAPGSGELEVGVIDLDVKEAAAHRANLSSDIILEEEKLRWNGLLHPLAREPVPNAPLPHGIGAAVELRVTLDGAPLEGVVAVMSLQGLRGSMSTTSTAATGADGEAPLHYDPHLWRPLSLNVTPRSRAWAGCAAVTGPRMTLALLGLPRSGPLGWWHQSLGQSRYDAELGTGIRVGIIDTGIGPHPYLAHAARAGAIVAGKFDQSPNATDDVAEHGTHVAGIVGARPTDLRDFAGIAPGADLVALRVYPGGGPLGTEAGFTTNGDIAQAITRLSDAEGCDLINLSSGGLLRSEIEIDRIVAAFNRGTLTISSAGNGRGPPVLFPASDPNVIAVSALGILNTTPPLALDTFSTPRCPDHYGIGGAYLASFSSFGPEVKCIAPGVGIISTVPTPDGSAPGYLAASGTSAAAPIVTATLAALLSRDATYKTLPRSRERALWAWNVLARTFRSLGLFPAYQGFGIPTVFS